jgi:hypothetical protein
MKKKQNVNWPITYFAAAAGFKCEFHRTFHTFIKIWQRFIRRKAASAFSLAINIIRGGSIATAPFLKLAKFAYRHPLQAS